MVWINYEHINYSPPRKPGEIVFGGAMCACRECARKREERKEDIKMAKTVNLREFIDSHLIPEFEAYITDPEMRRAFYDLVEEAELSYLEEANEKVEEARNQSVV